MEDSMSHINTYTYIVLPLNRPVLNQYIDKTHPTSNEIHISHKFPGKGKFWGKIIEVHIGIRERRWVGHGRSQEVEVSADMYPLF